MSTFLNTLSKLIDPIFKAILGTERNLQKDIHSYIKVLFSRAPKYACLFFLLSILYINLYPILFLHKIRLFNQLNNSDKNTILLKINNSKYYILRLPLLVVKSSALLATASHDQSTIIK